MLIYYIILAFILIFAFPMCIYKPSVLKKRVYVISVFSILYVVSAFRYGTGNDYFNYYEIYNLYIKSTNFAETLKIVIEPSFSLLNWTLSRFTDDIIFVNAVYSFIILTPVAYVIMKRSENVWISCFLYICLTFYYTTLNFTRQSMAASFIFLAFYLYEKRKYFVAILFIIVSVSFHLTAIVFIPVFLLCLIRPEKYLYAAYSVLVVICYFSIDILFDFAANLMAIFINPRYGEYIGSRYTQSLGWHFVLIPIMSFFIIYMTYNSGWKKIKNTAIYTNLSFFSAVIWFFITKIMILERLSMYFYIFIILSIPSAVNYFFGDINDIGMRFISGFFNLNTNSYNKRKLNVNENLTNNLSSKSKNIKAMLFIKKGNFNARNYRNKQAGLKKVANRKKFSLNKIIYCSIFSVYALSCIIYHSYGLVASVKGFHGVNPYRSGIAVIQRINVELSGRSKKNLLFDAARVYDYLLLLTGNDCSVIISGQPSANPYLDSVSRATLNNMGIKYGFEEMKSDCFIVVINNGKNIFEKNSTERLEYSTELCEKEIQIISDVEESSILIDKEQHSLGHSGLNIVVLDNYGNIISNASVIHDKNGIRLTRFR